MRAAAVELAGTRLLKILNMVNTRMFEFKHPKYYTELRKRNKSDQAISKESSTEENQRAPGPGQQRQASSNKLRETQASSGKHQAPSSKRQA